MDETGAGPTAKPAQTPPKDPLLAPRLTDGQLALLHRYGEVRPTVAGQEPFREGDRGYDFIVILSGAVTVLDYRFEGTGVFYTPLAAQDQVDPGDAVVIAGGGNSAGQAATWLADHRHPVTIVIGGDDLAASMSRYLIDRVAIRFVSERLGRRAGFAAAGALAR